MSGQILPLAPCGFNLSPGHIAMPARWAKVYIPAVPCLFDGTLMFNLQYGILVPIIRSYPKATQMRVNKFAPRTAIWNACEAMGMTPSLIGADDFDVGTGGERLKMSDQLIVCIVRALVARTDVIMMAGVLDILGEMQGRKVLQVLSAYVDEGALPGTWEGIPQMHAKTVIYSTRATSLQEMSDTVLSFDFTGVAEV